MESSHSSYERLQLNGGSAKTRSTDLGAAIFGSNSRQSPTQMRAEPLRPIPFPPLSGLRSCVGFGARNGFDCGMRTVYQTRRDSATDQGRDATGAGNTLLAAKADLGPWLAWQNVQGAVSHVVEVSRRADFASLERTLAAADGPSGAPDAGAMPPPPALLFYRARGVDGCGNLGP